MSKISTLALAAPLDGTETVVLVQGGTTKRASLSDHLDSITDPIIAAAEAARTAAQGYAALALGASGPAYANVAAGEAATDAGEFFAVANGDGSASIYLRTGGGSTFQRRTEIILSPLQFGAAGDGVTADHGAFIAMIAAIGDAPAVVDLKGRTYLFGAANAVPLKDNISYKNGTIAGSAATAIPNAAGDTYGRWANALFWKPNATPFARNFFFDNVHFDLARSKLCGIGGVVCNAPASNVGTLALRGGTSCQGYAPGNAVPLAAVAGQSATESGSLINLNGYQVDLDDLGEVVDCGVAIYLPNSKRIRGRKGHVRRAGISADYAIWHNCAGLVANMSREIDLAPTFVLEETGGTALFAAEGNVTATRYRLWPTIIGAGLSAIAVGVRAVATAQSVIDVVDVSGARVQGFMCAPTANLHNGVDVVLDDNFNSQINTLISDGLRVDFLAPWEAFDEAAGSVTGSYNVNKTVGHDCGNNRGISAISKIGTGKRIGYWVGKDMDIRHAPAIAIGMIGVVKAHVTGRVSRTGWSKTALNAPFGIQNPLYMQDVSEVYFDFTLNDPCPKVTNSNAYCAALYYKDVDRGVGKIRVTGETNQRWSVRLSNAAAGRTLDFLEYEPGPCVTLDGGRKVSIDSSASAANNAAMELSFPNSGEFDVSTGYGQLYPNARNIKSTAAAAGTYTLPTAKNMKRRSLIIAVKAGAGVATVAPAAGDTIDGAAAAIAVNPGSRVTLMSSGVTDWQTIPG